MKKKTVLPLLIVGLILLTILISYYHITGKNDKDTVSSGAELSDEALAKPPSDFELNEFDRALIDYLCINGYYDSDFIVSPAAFRASLCLAAVSAEGNTRTELLGAAGFAGMDELDVWYQAYLNVMNGRSCYAGVSVWNDADKLGEFTDRYRQRIQPYSADAYVCSADEMTGRIGGWFGEKTGGVLSSVKKDVSGASSVLVSTMYLTDTTEAEQTGDFLYAAENGTQILAFPISGNLSFVCFTGNRTDMFDKLALFGEKKETVRVRMPEFELRSDFDAADLLNFLLTRGVGSSLNGQTANFYNMCQDSDWFLQELIQAAQISFTTTTADGNGSAAASEAESSGEAQEITEFAADKLFSFIIFYGFGTSDQQALIYGQLTGR